MTVTVTASGGTPIAFHVHVVSPQTTIDHACVQIDYGDGLSEPSSCEIPTCAERYGPWTPPNLTPDEFDTTYEHAYASPGAHTAKFHFQTTSTCAGNPYTNEVSTTITVNT